MTKEDIITKLKAHLSEEETDAKAYYQMAKAAKEMGEHKLSSMLANIGQEEICHRHKIRKYLGMNGITMPDEEEDEEKVEFLAYQLKKL